MVSGLPSRVRSPAIAETDEAAELFGAGRDIETPIPIEIGDGHGANGRVGRSPGLAVGEVAVTVVEVNEALAGIAAGINDVVEAGCANRRDGHAGGAGRVGERAASKVKFA